MKLFFISIFFLIFTYSCTNFESSLYETLPEVGCNEGDCDNGLGNEIVKISGSTYKDWSNAIYQEYSGYFYEKEKSGLGTLKEFSIIYNPQKSSNCYYNSYGCIFDKYENYLFVGYFEKNKKNGYGKMRINNLRINYDVSYPFYEIENFPIMFDIIEGEWQEDILIKTYNRISGLSESESKKIIYQ